jgi:hypothetical protein
VQSGRQENYGFNQNMQGPAGPATQVYSNEQDGHINNYN